jgi:GT2 family glycosyltransferase
MAKVTVVVPNWNGGNSLKACLDSLLIQSLPPDIIVVDNGSVDESVALVESKYPAISLIKNKKNKGFAGGVNDGFKEAIRNKATYVACFNNDAVADKNWLKLLVESLDKNQDIGVAAPKILMMGGKKLDSVGESYTTWGLPYPTGRGEPDTQEPNKPAYIFGASGGASLYRVKMLKEIGLFDKDFFAYYEDVDLSFRAQLSGWKIMYVPGSRVEHKIGETTRKIKGFTTYQTMKNLPWLMYKNVPAPLIFRVLPRFDLAYFGFYLSAWKRGDGWPATKGVIVFLLLLPKKIVQRSVIQKNQRVTNKYISEIMTYDLPPQAVNIRKLRARWWKLTGKSNK